MLTCAGAGTLHAVPVKALLDNLQAQTRWLCVRGWQQSSRAVLRWQIGVVKCRAASPCRLHSCSAW